MQQYSDERLFLFNLLTKDIKLLFLLFVIRIIDHIHRTYFLCTQNTHIET